MLPYFEQLIIRTIWLGVTRTPDKTKIKCRLLEEDGVRQAEGTTLEEAARKIIEGCKDGGREL